LALRSFGVALPGRLACRVGILVALPVLTVAIADVCPKLSGGEPPVPVR
jgi:uncharacterized membrane protein